MFFQRSVSFCGLMIGGLLLAINPNQRVFAQSLASTGFRVVSYNVVKAGMELGLEQGVLGADGTTMHPVTALPRGFALEAAAQSGTRNLYLLRKTGRDTVMLLLTDSVGRTMQQPRQHMPRMSGEAKQLVPLQLVGLPGGKGFVLTYPSGKSGRPALQVQALSPTLAVLWQQQYSPACLTAVQHIAASDTQLWLVLKEYLALGQRPRVLSFRLATGDAECNQALAPNDELDVALAVPTGLLILGTSDRRTSYVAPADAPKAAEYRRDFALLLSPTGQRNFGVGLGWPPSSRPAHYRWQAAVLLPDGGYQLIGETYRIVPNAGTLALGLLGVGMLGFGGSGIVPTGGYINAQPVGLVLARLNTTGQLAAVHELAVAEVIQAPGSTAMSNGFPNYATAFRFRGLSADQQQVVLNTSRQVLAYSIPTHQLRSLTPVCNAIPTVRCIEADRVTISWSFKSTDIRPEFEQIALP